MKENFRLSEVNSLRATSPSPVARRDLTLDNFDLDK